MVQIDQEENLISFGMTVIASDPRVEDSMDFVDELVHPDEVDFLIPRANFVVSTVPETPRTQNYFDKTFFCKMKNEAYFINIGRGTPHTLWRETHQSGRSSIIDLKRVLP